ncbi:MAG: glycosyltransferase [Candidatus Aenigmarchaeota archaeon]|nr:glycosyltransferase [Candidatus Aenigmarchaeota archaeon]
MKKQTVSLLVPAHNEEKNIGKLLKNLLAQKLSSEFVLQDIVVVASGCTDSTVEIVKKFLQNPKIKLIIEERRTGKASAINLFLKVVQSEILVMISADVLPINEYTLNNLLIPFHDPSVGMTAGRPIPIENHKTLTTRISGLVWHLHHKISLTNPPKVGEIIAFRNVIEMIPEDIIADEEVISYFIQKKGYRIVYAKDAVVLNRPPRTISELITQRKRIFVGHLQIKQRYNHTIPTMNVIRLIKVVIKEIISNPTKFFTIVPLCFLETYIRFLGFLEYLTGKFKTTWNICKTTKKLSE